MGSVKLNVRVVLCLAVFLPIGAGWSMEGSSVTSEIVVERVLIRSLQEVDIPAPTSGILDEVLSREGELVNAGEVLAKLHDEQAVFALKQAQTQAAMARHLAENHLPLDTAEKNFQRALQAVKQQASELKAAQLEAENPLRSQAAEKNQEVAKNELERAKRSRESFVNSVSESELDGLRLNFEKAGLEAAQALFEMQLAQLKSTAAADARQTLLLAAESAEIEVNESKSRIALAALNAELKTSELDAAKFRVEEHQLRSKLDGVVVEVYRQPGEWVEPGDPVLRILKLNRLRAEAFVRIDDLGFSLDKAQAELEVVVSGETVRVAGVITFLSPEIDPINREASVWVEFDNPDLHVKPGMHARLKILP